MWVFNQPCVQPGFTSQLRLYLLLPFLRHPGAVSHDLACLPLAAASASAWPSAVQRSREATNGIRHHRWLPPSSLGQCQPSALSQSSSSSPFSHSLPSPSFLRPCRPHVPIPTPQPNQCPVIYFWSGLSYLRMIQVPSIISGSLFATCPFISPG